MYRTDIGAGGGLTPKTLNPKAYTRRNPHIYHKPPTPEDPHVDCIVTTIACARSIAGVAKDEGPASAASVEGIHMCLACLLQPSFVFFFRFWGWLILTQTQKTPI